MTMLPQPLASKVLLIGWDAADWRVIDPLLAQGKMPHLARFLSEGVRGNIATLYPAYSPMLWTSIATGKRAYKHGIHGFSEPTPDGRGVRPITNLARTTKAMWNILHQANKTCNIVGWWPSHPAEPIRGVMVSNHYQQAHGPLDKPWRMMPGTVSPERLAKPLTEFRLHPGELDHTHIGPFVPRWQEVDQDKDKRLEGIAKTLCEVTSIHGAATALMQLEPWDFMAVYYDGIDHFGHGFMRYHPPLQDGVDPKDFELYNGVIEAAYRYHDLMLGALLALAGPETTVILMSDHGFHPDENRPAHIPVEPAGPAVEHRHYGILALRGPGIRQGETIFGSSVLDICPTVLRLFGLPMGQDMDGKVLATAFEQAPEPATIPSWDDVPGESGRHPAGKELDPVAAAETMRQLIDLGYVEPLPDDTDKAVRQTVRELRFNLAQAYMGGMRFADAADILADLWEQWPEEHRFGITLAACQLAMGRKARRRATLATLATNFQTFAVSAKAELDKHRNAEGKLDTEGKSKAETHELRRLSGLANPNYALLRHLQATQHFMEGNAPEAIALLEKSGDTAKSPEMLVRLGWGFLRVQQRDRAETCFQSALAQDAEMVEAHLGLAETYDQAKSYEEMLSSALTATELVFYNPRAHSLVGKALVRLKKYKEAEQAFELALHQNPTERTARRGLTLLYGELNPNAHKAVTHRQRILRLRDQMRTRRQNARARLRATEADAPQSPVAFSSTTPNFTVPPESVVTIVSGLPRSGTSMMMQMLVAGGIAPFTDGQREPDIDNPRGYFEHEQATRLGSHAEWLPDARGKVVKIVAPLLPRLPATEHYRIVLMHRELSEVIASQKAMLARLERTGGTLPDDKLASSLSQEMERVTRWSQAQPHVAVLHLDYRDVLSNPAQVSAQIADFLARPVDTNAMQGAVDPSLRRQKREPDVAATV